MPATETKRDSTSQNQATWSKEPWRCSFWKTLALEPMHGYGVALRIEQISNGVFRVNPGSLLPALSRMERAGRVKSEWRATENNRRAKYYLLTANGRKALTAETEQWQRQILAISRILEA